MELRPAENSDLSGIASLITSDPNYRQPAGLAERLDGMVAGIVAVDRGRIVGYQGAEPYSLLERSSNGKVAEIKRLFVAERYRGLGLGKRLVGEIESKLKDLGFVASVGQAVCGHPFSQMALERNGYFPTGFLPASVNNDTTNRGTRESLLIMMKYLDENYRQKVFAQRTVFFNADASNAVYSIAGLGQARVLQLGAFTGSAEDVAKEAEWFANMAKWPGYPDDALQQPMLPHVTIDIANPQRLLRVAVGIRSGWVPAGVFPLAESDRLIMMRAPKGLNYDSGKVEIISEAKPLVEAIGKSLRPGNV